MTKTLTTSSPLRTFSNGDRTRRFTVADDGTVRAWDSVAGHFTTCHSLTVRQMAAIRRLAN